MVLENLDRAQWTFEQALAHVEAVVVAHRQAEVGSKRDESTLMRPAWLEPEDPTAKWQQEAKEQLLVALRDGDLHAQGRYTEERPYSWRTSGGGFGLHSGYYSDIGPEHWLEGILDRGILTGSNWQFIDIRLPRFVVLAIWPAYVESAAAEPADASAYTTPYLELMRRAIAEFGLGEANQAKKELLVDWFQRQQIDGEPVSANLADAMATLVRLPASQRGGARRPRGPELSQAS